MYITTTGTIVAQLTRMGRQILADNSANFKVTQWQLSDDEINYANFNGDSIDAPNQQILSTPILEADTFGGVPSQRFSLFSLPNNTLQIARIDTDIGLPFKDGHQNERPQRSRSLLVLNSDVFNINNPVKFNVRTFYGYDTYYLVSDNADFLNAGGQQSWMTAVGGPNGANQTRIVVPFSPKIDGLPCSDPWETLQEQTQAEISILIDINPESYILNNFATTDLQTFVNNFDLSKDLQLTLPKAYTEDQIVSAWMTYLINRLKYGVPTTGYLPGGDTAVREVPFEGTYPQTVQFVDQYKEVGIARSDISIRGSDTGKLHTVSCLIYSGSILSNILRTALQGV